jgi:hypothetical protein
MNIEIVEKNNTYEFMAQSELSSELYCAYLNFENIQDDKNE